MAVSEKNARETVVRHAASDVENKMQQVFHSNVDGAGEVHVMFFEAVRDGG